MRPQILLLPLFTAIAAAQYVHTISHKHLPLLSNLIHRQPVPSSQSPSVLSSTTALGTSAGESHTQTPSASTTTNANSTAPAKSTGGADAVVHGELSGVAAVFVGVAAFLVL